MPRRRFLPGPAHEPARPTACHPQHAGRPAIRAIRCRRPGSSVRSRTSGPRSEGAIRARRRSRMRTGRAASSRSSLERTRPHGRGDRQERRRRSASACPRTSRGQKVVGFGFDRDHLIEAGIERAGAVAAVTSGDNSNILTARIARENFGIDRVVARINDPRRARDLPAARHPDRRDDLVDHRPGDAPAPARPRSSRTSGSTRAARSASSTTRSPPSGRARSSRR